MISWPGRRKRCTGVRERGARKREYRLKKRYATGMYGGKFLPYHWGLFYCLETASRMCEKVWQILMTGCVQEEEILRRAAEGERAMLSAHRRLERMEEAGRRLGNVETILLDISDCRTPDGQEDWDAETPLILERCGRFDAVFGSEPSYAPYFSRAYPWADYILVDPPRVHYPISGTAIRSGKANAEKWMV